MSPVYGSSTKKAFKLDTSLKLDTSTLSVEKGYMAGSSKRDVRDGRGLSVANLLIVPIRSSFLSRTTDLSCACGGV